MYYIVNMNSKNFQAKQSSSFRSIIVVLTHIYIQQTQTEMEQKIDLCLI